MEKIKPKKAKYQKKDCNFTSELPLEIKEFFDKAYNIAHSYGHVRPQISLNMQGQKVIAVGDQVHISNKWKTFHDFLFYYIINCFGKEWGKLELQKNFTEMHPVLKWYKEVYAFQKKHFSSNGNILSATCTGIVNSYLSLAYDLYLLKHHSILQKKLISRLKNKDQFQGARYEVYVAASFIKAGFDLELENENDRSQTHCEFTAIYKKTNEKFSIEAKSRHRSGFLGHKGKKQRPEEIKLRIGGLVNKALKKEASHKRIIFIDVNMPPEQKENFDISWFSLFSKTLTKIENELLHKKNPIPAYIFLTNHPAHYVDKDEIEPSRNFFITAINIPEFKQQNQEIAEEKHKTIFSLWSSIINHTKIPHEFYN